METFAFLVGTVSLILAALTIVMLFILRKNIVDILNKDALIFNENYQIKKAAIEKAMMVVDEIESGAPRNFNSQEYIKKINSIYNELICVVSDTKLSNRFYEIAYDRTKMLQPADFVDFKSLCRKDLGLKTNKNAILSKLVFNQQMSNQPVQPTQPAQPSSPTQPTQPRPVQPRPVQPTQTSAQSPTTAPQNPNK